MTYNVIVTASAEQDLDAIIRYIVVELKNPPAARHILNEVEKIYSMLAESPMIYAECHQPLLKSYRKASFMRYLMLFKINDGTVYVERFFSELEDYADKL